MNDKTSQPLLTLATTIHTDVTTTGLATAPGSPAALPSGPRASVARLMISASGTVTLAAPAVMGLYSGRWYELKPVRYDRSDVALVANQGVAVELDDWCWCEGLWLKSATLTGAGLVSVVLLPIETW